MSRDETNGDETSGGEMNGDEMNGDEMNGDEMSPNDLDRDERELRKDGLSRQLRTALVHEHAPEAWARAALAAPRRPAEVPASSPVRDEPWILAILPHLLGLALLAGLCISLWSRPDIILGLLKDASNIRTADPVAPSPLFIAAALLTPVAILLLVEGSRGFPLVRRWIVGTR